MKIEQLEQLMKIVEEGSMNEAAKKLYVARSSLSTSMKNLESELGSAIFNRSSTGVQLTGFGKDVYGQARDICEKIAFLQSLSGDDGFINLSVSSMYCSLANDALVEIYSRHEKDDFTANIEEGTLSAVVNQVSSGISDIGIVTLFSDSEAVSMRKLEDNGLEFNTIIERNLCAIVGKKNPLYHQDKNTVELSELKDYPYIVNYASPSDFSWERTLDGRQRKRADIQVSDLGCALQLINNSSAIMIDTYDKETYAKLYAANDLKFIPLNDLPLKCKLGWVKIKERKVSNIAQEFINILIEKSIDA